MKRRLYEYETKADKVNPIKRNHVVFADMVDKLQRIIPNVRDVAQSSYEYDIEDINNAILNYDLDTMREISNYFWRASLPYKRLILYFSTIHKFYWIDIPTVVSVKQSKNNKNEKTYYEILNYLQRYRFPDSTPDILSVVFRDGAYYGYLIEGEIHNTWQQLPTKYCRSNYRQNGIPVVEFNIKYFDDEYRQEEDRELALKKYPSEFKQWYNKYKNGIVTSTTGSEVWVPLKAEYCTRFALSDDECPVFFALIPEIIRLEKNKKIADEQALQQLFKLLVQKMPLNKNSDLIFDVEETKAIHKQASNMLSKAPGVDLFTTWADVELLNLDTTEAQSRASALTSSNSFWDQSGTSPMLFATNGNISLSSSQKKDLTIIFKILESYSTFINMRLNALFNMKQINHHFKFIDVTELNQEDMVKLYKEHATLGYSKLLVSIAMGINQAELPGLLDLENNVLKIGELLIPLSTSYTSTSKDIESITVNDEGGRPEKEDSKKASRTIENIN